MKIGSLFDGSGGFPLAFSICGAEPIWASEVEPYPIAVTRSRFPNMKHLGDVSKINGAKIEPVDIITFGSPCQDMSIAGNRAGLKHEEHGDVETTRSGLFYEAVRIFNEMRIATFGQYPRFIIWENVPGAFSSNKGRDFKSVLEAFCSAGGDSDPIPMPEKNKWGYAGEIVGDTYSVAWRTHDAQYWGVPQRRRRIYVVADLNGSCAGEVLFKPESLRGDSAASNEAGEEATADALGRAGRGIGNEPGYGSSVIALQANGIDRADTAGCNGAGWRENEMYTLNTIDRHAIVYPDVVGTLAASGAGLNRPAGQGNELDFCIVKHNVPYQKLIGALCSTDYKWVQQQQVEPNKIIVTEIDNNAPQLASGNPVVSTLLSSCSEKMWLGDQEAFSGNYHILGKGTPPRHYVVRRLHPIECARLQGFPDWWGELAEFDGDIVFWEDVRKTLANIAGTTYKPSKNLKKWYNGLHTDASEYKMWGNGIALPFAVYVAKNIIECTMKA